MKGLVEFLYGRFFSVTDMICISAAFGGICLAYFGHLPDAQQFVYGALGWSMAALIVKVPYWVWKLSKRNTKKVSR